MYTSICVPQVLCVCSLCYMPSCVLTMSIPELAWTTFRHMYVCLAYYSCVDMQTVCLCVVEDATKNYCLSNCVPILLFHVLSLSLPLASSYSLPPSSLPSLPLPSFPAFLPLPSLLPSFPLPSSLSPTGNAQVTCYPQTSCQGSPITGLTTARDCCLGDGFSYNDGTCRVCNGEWVYGWYVLCKPLGRGVCLFHLLHEWWREATHFDLWMSSMLSTCRVWYSSRTDHVSPLVCVCCP